MYLLDVVKKGFCVATLLYSLVKSHAESNQGLPGQFFASYLLEILDGHPVLGDFFVVLYFFYFFLMAFMMFHLMFWNLFDTPLLINTTHVSPCMLCMLFVDLGSIGEIKARRRRSCSLLVYNQNTLIEASYMIIRNRLNVIGILYEIKVFFFMK